MTAGIVLLLAVRRANLPGGHIQDTGESSF
jgi:hypothetical protein